MPPARQRTAKSWREALPGRGHVVARHRKAAFGGGKAGGFAPVFKLAGPGLGSGYGRGRVREWDEPSSRCQKPEILLKDFY